MELTEILEQHRSHYLKHFIEMSKKCNGSEILVDQKNDEEIELFRLYRFDCIERNEDDSFKILEYNHESFLNHPTISFKIYGVDIELNPIYWNGVEIDVYEFNEKWEEIHIWALKWIGVEDEKDFNSIGELSGFLHNYQKPDISEGKVTLAIDFGTSDVLSILELIEILADNEATKINIHSGSMINGDE